MAATSTHQNNPFIKSLAANDRQVRDRALTQLKAFLSRSTPFTPTDQLRLWKGLFYTMWSADKPRYQQALARDLASLTFCFANPANTTSFLRAFWETMSREWNGIEVLRMDKFLYLVRQFLGAGFDWLKSRQHKWGGGDGGDGERRRVLDILAEFPLNARDHRVPNGLRYHVIDIYVDELDRADSERDAPVDEMLVPLRKLAKDSPTKSIRERAREALDDERVGDWKGENKEEKEEEEASDDDDDEFGGFDD